MTTPGTSLLARDANAVWHPFTQHGIPSRLLTATRAEGCYIYDADSNRYTDLISSWWVSIHGHSHPAVVAAVCKQAATLDHVLFAGATHEPAVRLAEVLLEMAGMTGGKVFYSDDGSTAVEVAIKMALQFHSNHGRPRGRIVALSGGYHGDTFGAMTLGKSSRFFDQFPTTALDVQFLDVPNIWDGHDDENADIATIQRFEEMISDGNCAAFIFEPLVQGAGGMKFHSTRVLQGLVDAANRHGVLVIADEIMTGFRRTGRIFATDWLDTPVDILCLSKGLSGGMLPLAATLAQGRVYDAFLGETFDRALAHGHSYTGNPIACAGAIASMQLVNDPQTAAACDALNAALRREFLPLGQQFDQLERARVIGGIAAIDIKPGRVEYGSSLSRAMQEFYLDRGLILRPVGRTIYLMPPYRIDEQEIARACGIIAESVDAFL